ncbi:MAG: hypothetical protein HKM00_03730 [Gallionella sp.]|nr:hypothetical protein [Gallionella sp.]
MRRKSAGALLSALTTISIGCAMFGATAFASTADIKASNNQIGIQAISTNVNYTETGTAGLTAQTGILDTETGSVPGYALSLSAMKDWWLGNDYFEAEYDHSSGNTTYTGAYQGGVFGSVVGTSSATLVNYSARYGKGFVINNQFMVTPYAELGKHNWDRGVNYGETYTHNYYGIGALGQYSPNGKLVLSANVLYGSTYGSSIAVNSGAGLNGFSGGLGNSSLYKLGVSADYAFTKQLHGNVGVDYTSFRYGYSAVYNGMLEPNSKTNYTMVKVGLGYAF